MMQKRTALKLVLAGAAAATRAGLNAANPTALILSAVMLLRPPGETEAGHPLWINPKTGVRFPMSHHHSQEVATGTLRSIKRAAGLI